MSSSIHRVGWDAFEGGDPRIAPDVYRNYDAKWYRGWDDAEEARSENVEKAGRYALISAVKDATTLDELKDAVLEWISAQGATP